jgi:pyridoxine/pyridoxamine 5'-phosphate oxidase
VIDPLTLLAEDRTRARENGDPCAGLCTLANVDAHGLPQARTVILRDLDDRLAVFVNATSPKFAHLGHVVAVVWLPSLNVQYRLACVTEPVPHDLVAESWQLRPEVPKHMDWLYTRVQGQSTPVASRATLLTMLASVELPDPLTAPSTASGFYLRPGTIDRLDLNQENGVHDRRRYTAGNPTWREEVLVP